MLLVVGFVIVLSVMYGAWGLYDDPAKIECFAAAVERGSNLDLTLSKAAAQAQQELEGIQAGDATLETDSAVPVRSQHRRGYRHRA